MRVQQDAEDDDRHRVHGVEQNDERHHPAGRAAALHARLAQGPVGERHAAGAGGGEQRGGGQARHRDLERGGEVEPPVDHVLAVAAAEDPAEERGVGTNEKALKPTATATQPQPDRTAC